MLVRTDVKNFVLRHFVISNFYGKDTCFAWSNSDEFVTFPYIYNADSTVVSKVLKAPDKIKDIRGLDGRIFILCFPQGIYKLTENLELASLSKTGLELLSIFGVLSLNDASLIFEDKTSERIVKFLSASVITTIDVLPLHYKNTETYFYKALAVNESNNDMDIYFLAVDKKLFQVVNQTIHLMYESDYLIKSIKSFEKENLVFGVVLITDSDTLVLVHVIDNKLIYKRIFLGANVKTVCPILCADGKVLLVHSDNEKTYYSTALLTTNSIRQVQVQNQIFVDIKIYKSNFMICLDDSSNLIQFPIEEIRNLCRETNCDYVGLQSNMLTGLESIVDVICEKTQELKLLRQDILQKEDTLKRINMFVNKQTLKYCPNDSVLRLLNNLFLISDFKKNLFENCTLVQVLKSRGKTMFLMKDVHDYETIIEMPINLSSLTSKLCITTDLLTYKGNSGIWCLIKDYVQDPLQSKANNTIFSSDKLDIVKYNLVVLKNLMIKNKLSMECLSEIKRKIRNATEL